MTQPCDKCGFFNCHGGFDCPARDEVIVEHGEQMKKLWKLVREEFMPDIMERSSVGKEYGLHRDGEKPRLADMIPADLMLEAGRIFAQNNQPRPGYPNGKYPDVDGKPNYKSGIRTTRLLDSMMRHLLALMNREDIDPDSGFDHAAHILCNLGMFWWMRANRKDMDDR